MSLFDQLFPRRGSLASSQILEAAVKPNQSSQGGNDVTDTTRFPSATFKIERTGTSTVSIGVGGSAQATVTLSPILPDATLANYLPFASASAASVNVWAAYAKIVSTSSIQVAAFEQVTSGLSTNPTGVTVAGNDLASVSQPASPATHGSDTFDGALGHAHTTTGHPVTDPQHTHTFSYLNPTAVTVVWMIIHK